MKTIPERIAEKVETIIGTVDIHSRLIVAINNAYNDGNTDSRKIFEAINKVHLIPQNLQSYVMDIIVDELWGDDHE